VDHNLDVLKLKHLVVMSPKAYERNAIPSPFTLYTLASLEMLLKLSACWS